MKKLAFLFFILLHVSYIFGQNLEDLLDEETEKTTEFVSAIFKSTKIVDGQSIENPAKGEFNFLICHHFGTLNSGFYDFYGLDESNIKLGLQFGITDRIALSVGRSSFDKIYDASAKVKIIQQQKGLKNIPFGISLYTEIAASALDYRDFDLPVVFEHRLSYAAQLLIASKLSELLSIQLSPTVVHQNLVNFSKEPNTKYALGIGGRIKLSKRTSINPEYFYNLNFRDFYNDHLSLGFDFETGGHIFQLYFGNSRAISTPQFIGETNGNWLDGDIRFGFSIHRFFVYSNKNKKNELY